MKLSSRQYAQALYSALSDCSPAEQKVRIKNFLALLQRQRRLKILPKIVEQFTLYHYQSQGILPVQATVAVKTDVDQLTKELTKKLKQPLALTVKVQPEILGGLKIQIADLLIDGSVQQKLINLREQINK